MPLFRFYSDLRLLIRRFIVSRKVKELGSHPFFGYGGSFIGGESIVIGSNFSVGNFYKLQCWNIPSIINKPKLFIGNNVQANDNFHVSCALEISIGDGCLFGDNVFISDNMHGNNSENELQIPPHERPLYAKGIVRIGKNVWIGRNVCVLPGVHVGDGAIIGANAVVTHDIPAYAIAVGVPASVLVTKPSS